MNRPSAIPSNIGFYLLLLFSFCVSVFPRLAVILGIVISIIWLAQLVIFGQPDFKSSRLLYPIAGLTLFSLVVFILSAITGVKNPTVCAGLYSFFYFVVFSFVPSQERRKMVIWTFLSGVVLSLGISVLSAVDISGRPDFSAVVFPDHLPLLILMVFCLGLAYFTESIGMREKLFFALIFLPIGIGVLAFDPMIILILFALMLVVGIIKDRAALVLLGVLVIMAYSGIFKTGENPKEIFKNGQFARMIGAPLKSIEINSEAINTVGFYGMPGSETEEQDISGDEEPFFVTLIKRSGPMSLLFFIWVIFELVRRDYAKIRKLNMREERAYHLASLMAIIVIVLSNIFESSLACSSALPALWMFMGMAEV